MKTVSLRSVVAVGLTGVCVAVLRRCLQTTELLAGPDKTEHLNSTRPVSFLKMAQVESLWGMFVGDALSMPVHWYYDPHDIKRDYGDWLKGYVAPKSRHPSSILTISAVGGAGRHGNGGRADPVIGSVILHDKLKYWQSNKRSIHYHQGMKAGDSTLNSLVAGQVMMSLSSVYQDHHSIDDGVIGDLLAAYVKFMTTPGTHDDTYAESFHREFFKDWEMAGSPVTSEEVLNFAESRSKRLMSSYVDHNIASIGALVMPIPVVLHCADISATEAVKHAVRLVNLTHCSKELIPFVEMYVRTLHAVLNGESLKDKAEEALASPLLGGRNTLKLAKKYSQAAASYGDDTEGKLQVYQEAVSRFGLACYIKGAVTSMFFLASEFHDNFEAGVLMNTNCGGENCHRGGALGALLGAEAGRSGREINQQFKSGLHSSQEIIQDIIDAWK